MIPSGESPFIAISYNLYAYERWRGHVHILFNLKLFSGWISSWMQREYNVNIVLLVQALQSLMNAMT